MKVREKLHEKFNVEEIEKNVASENVQFMLFGHGFLEGMLAAAAILESEWFKTQQECVEAIRKASRSI
ncbi:hypothetical protein B7759_01379 [Burkholderia glumae]|uniref:hypothetical protein n=1 Tax=Burkholderia glumae TaxID=337 RepID=UPI001AE66923|nr:hypothetical protein [Burkholderia glumae]QTP32801.1 hypothetical protein B7759_01379 [Burkholderia glumae]